MTLKTVVVIAQKGGTGKTTLVHNLALEATTRSPFWYDEGARVAALETDEQGSLEDWFEARGDKTNPLLAYIGPTGLGPVIHQLREHRYKLAFVDTEGASNPEIAAFLKHADLALIPVTPSKPDLKSAAKTLGEVQAAGTPFAFILNRADSRSTLPASALETLKAHGPVANPIIYERTDLKRAYMAGQGIAEHAPNSKAAAEIRELFTDICNRLWPEQED